MEPIGEHKARITLNSWEDARVVSADEALIVVGIGKVLRLDRTDRPAEYLNVDPTGMTEAGYGPLANRRTVTV